MLERFHVKEKDLVSIDADKLRNTTEKILSEQGLSKIDSIQAADVLISADLRGVETHGVSNMLRAYIGGYSNGNINPKPNWKIVRETASCATIDCDAGLGVVITPKAMDIAIEKAKKTGVGLVSMGNGRHLGMAAYHAMKALEHDMIGTCMTSCSPRMVPTFSSKAAVGTNPISYAAPAGKLPPFVFDAAMTSVAGNKITLASRLGVPLEGGWISDDKGNPIMEEVDLSKLNQYEDDSKNLESRYELGGYKSVNAVNLLPFGGTREIGSHKGYSMAMVVDILGGILNGTKTAPTGEFMGHGHFVAAYSVDAFMDVTEFKNVMDSYLQSFLDLPSNSEGKKVVYAGYIEHLEQVKRANKGIPLHVEVVRWFEDVCKKLDIDSIK